MVNLKEIRQDLKKQFTDIIIFNDKNKTHRRIKIATCCNIKKQDKIEKYLNEKYPSLVTFRNKGSGCYNGYFNGVCFRLPL